MFVFTRLRIDMKYIKIKIKIKIPTSPFIVFYSYDLYVLMRTVLHNRDLLYTYDSGESNDGKQNILSIPGLVFLPES